jgi:hypothetical protein
MIFHKIDTKPLHGIPKPFFYHKRKSLQFNIVTNMLWKSSWVFLFFYESFVQAPIAMVVGYF